MRMQRLWAMFVARNREFYRDRSAFGWNFLFPFLIIIGFAVIFQGDYRSPFKVGVFPVPGGADPYQAASRLPAAFTDFKAVVLIGLPNRREGVDRLNHHRIDLLIEADTWPLRYWVNEASPSGAVAERLLREAMVAPDPPQPLEKVDIQGVPIRYIDWLFPGVLGMNMMFSALYGVGWVVVRYRKNGVLKRLNATPLTAVEYLSAQMLSRMFVLMVSLVMIWAGCEMLIDFNIYGSLIDLFIIFLLGSACMTALGLVVASRGTSEEFANGLLNFICWPMMFLSEVWFSIEGAPDWLRAAAHLFPLTHLLSAARRVMNEGAGLTAVMPEIGALGAMTACFLVVGAAMFAWNK